MVIYIPLMVAHKVTFIDVFYDKSAKTLAKRPAPLQYQGSQVLVSKSGIPCLDGTTEHTLSDLHGVSHILVDGVVQRNPRFSLS